MRLGEILHDLFQVSEGEIEKALELQREVGGYIGQILLQLGIITETQLLIALSHQLKVPLWSEEDEIDLEIPSKLNSVNLNFLLENNFIPIKIDETTLTLLTNDPLKTYVLDYLTRTLNKECKLFLAEERKLKELEKKLFRREEQGVFLIEKDITKLKDMALEAPVVRYLNDLIASAVSLGASDIHFEPSPNFRLRLRVDGVLHDFDFLKEDFFFALVSRVKLLSGLDIAEKRLPQDGKFSTRVGTFLVDLRVSTLPTPLGEDVVLRLLYRSGLNLDLTKLGLEEDHLDLLKKLIKNPYGILLITGPTGSGKTTTLYSIINTLKSKEKKIITIEDPVEYQIEGITQIQVKPDIGLTFANALRSILRHDPDIIMVGEIRDPETAQIAIQSALTGHLVLSTLHTNDSLSTLFRLLDMEIEGYLINATLLGVIAQRIIRLACPECMEKISLEEEIKKSSELSSLLKKFPHLLERPKLVISKGCKKCLYTGYKGRTAIFEILNFSEELKEIFKKTYSLRELKEHLYRSSTFRTLREDGLIKVLKGKTTLEEVWRVT